MINQSQNSKDLNLDKGRFTGKQNQKTSFDNNSNYDYVSIFMGLSKINQFFGDSPNEDDYLDHALNCLRQIGNFHTDLYGFTGITDSNGELCLPTAAFSIEYVTDGDADWQTWSFKNQISQLHAPGNFISYKFLGDKVVTDEFEKPLSIAYRTFKQDEEGLPMVTEREAEACAYWWKWVDVRREMYKGNPIMTNVFPLATKDKNKAVNQARIPERFSQNFMDQLGNIVYSRDRKIYNRSYKAVKIS